MRIFGMSDRARPWEYLHNGYISAAGGEVNGVRLRGVAKGVERRSSTTTFILTEPQEVDRTPHPDTLHEYMCALCEGPITVPDWDAEILAHWLRQNGVRFEIRAGR